MLVTTTLSEVVVLLVQAKPLSVKHRPRCPDCGAELYFLGFRPSEIPSRRIVDNPPDHVLNSS
jgi:hypothetical protein